MIAPLAPGAAEIADPATGRVYFSARELADPLSGTVRLQPGFATALLRLRLDFGRAMNLTSACRSAAHNRAIRGHPRSLHVYDRVQHPGQRGTLAVDVALDSGPRRIDLVRLALAQDWSVGVAVSFVHLDRRGLLGLEQRLFGYG